MSVFVAGGVLCYFVDETLSLVGRGYVFVDSLVLIYSLFVDSRVSVLAPGGGLCCFPIEAISFVGRGGVFYYFRQEACNHNHPPKGTSISNIRMHGQTCPAHPLPTRTEALSAMQDTFLKYG